MDWISEEPTAVLELDPSGSSLLCAPNSDLSADIQKAQNDIGATVMAIASHDLRQPLQVIMLEGDLLARSFKGDEGKRARLTRIRRAVTRIADTLDRLLEVLRQDVLTQNSDEQVSLCPMLNELKSELRESAKLKNVTLRFFATSTVIYSHTVLLSAIMRNLIRNAIEHTPPGGRVLVACRRRGSKVHIEIRDSGIGIAAGELKTIFGPFYRSDASSADGLGLGLFIVERAAKLIGHHVMLRSAPGRGSCFVVVANAVPGHLQTH